MVLHAPIGLLIGLAAIELIGVARRKPVPADIRLGLIWLVALTAIASIISGLLLNRGGGYPERAVWLHQWMGIGSGVVMVLAAAAAQARRTAIYGLLLGVAMVLLIPVGHLGAGMTHGEDFLFEPFRAPRRVTSISPVAPVVPTPAADPGPPQTTYARAIAPLMELHCVSCHGATKHKGGLSLHTPEAIAAGGDLGPSIEPGDPDASELIRRLKLPLDDEEHMPPRSKDQMRPEEVALLEAWIRAGARFDSTDELGASPGVAEPLPAVAASPAPAQADIDVLRGKLVHVEPLARESPLVIVDAAAAASSFGDDEVAQLLGPLVENIADLSLARSTITDRSMALITTMPHLRRLNIAGTAVGDEGLKLLARHQRMEELVLTQTAVTDAGLASVADLPSLRRLYIWGSKVTPEGVDHLRHSRGELGVDAGQFVGSEVIAVEPDVVLTAVDAAPAAAASLKPVNTLCPVSEKPVDPEFAIVRGGQVIGFCCRHCLGKFLEEPAKYTVKTP